VPLRPPPPPQIRRPDPAVAPGYQVTGFASQRGLRQLSITAEGTPVPVTSFNAGTKNPWNLRRKKLALHYRLLGVETRRRSAFSRAKSPNKFLRTFLRQSPTWSPVETADAVPFPEAVRSCGRTWRSVRRTHEVRNQRSAPPVRSFLFKIEHRSDKPGSIHWASMNSPSRLSYFLWSTMSDEETQPGLPHRASYRIRKC